MTEYLRMSGLYWGLTTLELLDKSDLLQSDEIMQFIRDCINDDGGISPCIGHDPHLLYTLSAVQVINITSHMPLLFLRIKSDFSLCLTDSLYIKSRTRITCWKNCGLYQEFATAQWRFLWRQMGWTWYKIFFLRRCLSLASCKRSILHRIVRILFILLLLCMFQFNFRVDWMWSTWKKLSNL